MSKAFISGCKDHRLNPDEQQFFADERPWGLILFRRNIKNPAQVAELVADFREAVCDPQAPVLVDQEGGRVQRLPPPRWPTYPPGRVYGALFETDPELGERAASLGARLIAYDLHALGITVDCLPLLDVPVAGAHDVIGDRAYGDDVETVSRLARAVADGLLAGGVLPVAKHIPGHGRAGADSHLELPRVDAPLEDLRALDFEPFRRLADLPLAMTAHVVYTALDAERPATTSPEVIGRWIRDAIGFDGCLMSDDLSMEALSGSLADRARASLEAGCDLVLHCNGVFEEMIDVAAVTPELAGEALARSESALRRLQPPEPFDPVEARAEFETLLAQMTLS